MILIVSNKHDATADFLQDKLVQECVRHVRVNTEHLATNAFSFSSERGGGKAGGQFVIGEQRVAFADVRAVYYRRPVAPVFSSDLPEGEREWMRNETRRAWGGALAAQVDIRWVNHPLNISAANYKPEQIARARHFRLNVPATLITTVVNDAIDFCERYAWAVIVKPIGHGEIIGSTEAEDQIVYTNSLSVDDRSRLDAVEACPTLLQQAIAKDIDVRVTVVDEEVIAVALHSQDRAISKIDCRRDNMTGMRYSAMTLPGELSNALVTLTRSYGLLYAAFDLVRDSDGRYWFLELNPAGQWAWLEQVADAPISPALIRCLTHD